jgi:hypothetical protein
MKYLLTAPMIASELLALLGEPAGGVIFWGQYCTNVDYWPTSFVALGRRIDLPMFTGADLLRSFDDFTAEFLAAGVREWLAGGGVPCRETWRDMQGAVFASWARNTAEADAEANQPRALAHQDSSNEQAAT